ncbi:MAG TPA: putative manganese-dependent inorganic diphosphatase [Opitutaceae bacterium]|nr:putative manganese-dependent inorganic diphosphatase [Opitutaceae bacterium]HPG16217.1 putative manganese-dependent inorganic diphosphatase [Opitutaceae bacterium]
MTSAAAAPNTPNATYIIGHRNPDADAVCSSIAYAAYKEARGESGYIAARCGNSNARIDTILQRFRQPLPLYLSDVTPRVRDLMEPDVKAIDINATCAEALELIEHHDIRILPVVTEDRMVVGTVSITQLGGHFVPRIGALREMRKVTTSLDHITRALKARVLHLENAAAVQDLYVRIGAMDVRSFAKIPESEGITASESVIIVGDRWDIQQRSIQIGVRLLVITGNLAPDPEVVEQAQKNGVSLIISAYDSATTAWVIRTANTIRGLLDTKFVSVGADLRINEVRKKFQATNVPAFMVRDDEGRLMGVLSKSDVLKPVKTRLALVDHNELSQAVPGADQVTIAEIIDHHRLGALNTQQPILFINEPVGSTCTIVADLFRREGRTPSPEIAGIMMSGIISDTLNLNSPTSTEKDAQILGWLAPIANVNPRELAEVIFASGSVILSQPPEKVIRSDFKIYAEAGARFSISQVEELGFANFWKHAQSISTALADLCKTERLLFASLLVTDINTQNSVLLVKGDDGFIGRITAPHIDQDDIFDMPGIVSRKKQLVPFLSSLIKEMQADGALPVG